MNETIFKTAFSLAKEAFQADEIPVGAVIFDSKTHQIIAMARNETEERKNPLAHAEILALTAAFEKLHQKRLNGCSVFVTLEPCALCAAALSLARVDHVYFGAFDPKTGGIFQGCCTFEHPQTHHKPDVTGGIHADECGKLLTTFFKNKRKKQ